MSYKPVIPTPPALRWREFRIRVIPALTFGLILLAAAIIWHKYIFPSALVGRVEAIRADVTPPQAGYVSQLFVTRFQRVSRGDPIAEINITRPEVMSNSLAVIRAEIDLLRTSMEPLINAQRASVNYNRLQLDYMRARVELMTAKENLKLARSEFQSANQLYRDKLVTDLDFEAARSKKETLQVQVEEQTKMVEKIGREIQNSTTAFWTNGLPDPHDQLQAALAVQDQKLRLAEAEMQPVLLRAPIDGLVSVVRQWSGETVAAGQPVATISACNSERIIGFLRQPLYIQPTTNMVVQVRTRGFHRETGKGRILAVGGQLQPINDILLPPTKYNIAEHGLPIIVSMPNEVRPLVHPGEFVDLTILP